MIVITTLFIVELGRQPTEVEKHVAFCATQGFIFCWTGVYAYGGYNAHDNLKLYTTLLNVYNHTRLAIIGLTLLAMGRLYYKMRLVTARADRHCSPLYHLTRRLLFYPIVQIICRLGPTPYEMIYHGTIDTYPESAPLMQAILLYVAVGLAPTAGIGGFLVFIYMQHGAKDNLKCMLKDILVCECKVESLSGKPATFEARAVAAGSTRLSELTAASPHYGDDDSTITPHQRASSPGHDRESHSVLEWSRLSMLDENQLMRQYINLEVESSNLRYLNSRESSAAGSVHVDTSIELGSSVASSRSHCESLSPIAEMAAASGAKAADSKNPIHGYRSESERDSEEAD